MWHTLLLAFLSSRHSFAILSWESSSFVYPKRHTTRLAPAGQARAHLAGAHRELGKPSSSVVLLFLGHWDLIS